MARKQNNLHVLSLRGTYLQKRMPIQIQAKLTTHLKDKSMAEAWKKENVINSEIGHAWTVDWMR
jgi:hypothetical protein